MNSLTTAKWVSERASECGVINVAPSFDTTTYRVGMNLFAKFFLSIFMPVNSAISQCVAIQ